MRTSGENGISRNMSTLINSMDVWVQKLLYAQYSSISSNNANTAANQTKSESKGIKIGEQEWMALHQMFDEWFAALGKTLECVGKPLKDVLLVDPMMKLTSDDKSSTSRLSAAEESARKESIVAARQAEM